MAQDRKNGNSDISMTAVIWLVRKLSMELLGEIPLHRWDEIREAVQQAKQMEKEQIVKAYQTADQYVWKSTREEAAEQYYNETYGKS